MSRPCAHTLASLVRESAPLTLRFFEGFDDRNGLEQPPHLPNHARWSLGHLAFTMARLAERLGAPPPDASDFVPGDRGDARAFGIESMAFGSTPTPDDDRYPGMGRATEIFDHAIERLASTVEGLDDEHLQREHPWGAASMPAWKLVIRVALHNGTHAGQMTDTRRALDLGRVIG